MIKIKYSLNDFRVTEVADIDFLEGGEYSYYLLVKAGLRTDECVSIIFLANSKTVIS